MKKILIMVMVLMLSAVAANAYVIQGNTVAHGIGTFTISSANNNAPTQMNDASGYQQWFVLPGAAGENTGTEGKYYYRMYKTPAPAEWTFAAFVENSVADPVMTVNIWGASSTAVADLVGKTWAFKVNGVAVDTKKWDASHLSTSAPMFTYTWKSTAGMEGASNAVICTLGEVVPEPGSILALASGLVGLVGFGVRRRK